MWYEKLASFYVCFLWLEQLLWWPQNDAQQIFYSILGFWRYRIQTFSYDNNSVKNCISYVASWDTNKPGDAEYKKMIIIIPD